MDTKNLSESGSNITVVAEFIPTYKNNIGFEFEELQKNATTAESETSRLILKINEVLRDGGLPALDPEFEQKLHQLYSSLGQKNEASPDIELDIKGRLRGLVYAEKITKIASEFTVPLFKNFAEEAKKLVKHSKEAEQFHREICETLQKNEVRSGNSRLVVEESQRRLNILLAEEEKAAEENPADLSVLLKRYRNTKESLSATIIKHNAIIDKCEKDRPGLEDNTLLAAELSTEAKSRLLEKLEEFKGSILKKVELELSAITCSDEEIIAKHQKIEAETASECTPDQKTMEDEAEIIAKKVINVQVRNSNKNARSDKNMRALRKKDFGIDVTMTELKELALRFVNGENSPEITRLTNKIKAARPDLFIYETYERKNGLLREDYPELTAEMAYRFHKEIYNKLRAIHSGILTTKRYERLKLDSETLNFFSIQALIEGMRREIYFSESACQH